MSVLWMRIGEMRTDKRFDKFAGSEFERTQCGPQGGVHGRTEYKFAGSEFERTQCGPKGEGQDARSNPPGPAR